MPVASAAIQGRLDDLGTPLLDVEFVVLDLETTGGSPANDRITEVGAVKIRGGEVLGTFQTLVNPGVPIPPLISALTGITNPMVADEEPIEVVLPCLLEFLGGAVLVAHNASFDRRFVQANLERHGYQRLANRVVCTARLARKLLPRDEVPNVRLATLAAYLGATVAPCHRALTDARATVDVFHSLLEQAGSYGVLALEDLIEFPSARAGASFKKVHLADRLPRRVPVPRRRRAGPVRRQGQGPPGPGAQLLLGRRAGQDRRPAARAGRHRPPAVRHRAGGQRARGAADPASPPPLQPPQPQPRTLLLPQDDPGAVPAAVGGPPGPARRRPLPGPLRLGRPGRAGQGGHRGRPAAAPLQHAAGAAGRRLGLRPAGAGPLPGPLHRRGGPGRLRRPGGHPGGGPGRRPRAGARPAAPAHGRLRGRAALRAGGGRPGPAGGADPRPGRGPPGRRPGRRRRDRARPPPPRRAGR